MKIICLVFARFDSSRLPGKALKDLSGKPMLERVFDRVKKAQIPQEVIFATSTRSIDDQLAEFTSQHEILTFRGSTNNLTKRAYDAAIQFNADAIVRICGDSPFIDYNLIDRMCQTYIDANQPDIVTNLIERTYPFGISVEVVKTKTLMKILSLTKDFEDLEHCTRYIYQNIDEFQVLNTSSNNPFYNGLRLVVDTPEDYIHVNKILSMMKTKPEDYCLDDIVEIAQKITTAENR